MQERYTHILERWFITEPPLFSVLCLHELVQNTQMSCPLRSGRKKLEYNPDIVREMSDDGLEEALRAEAVRLLLKHPYERRPEGCSQKAMGLGSNLVVGDNYKHPRFRIETPEDFGLKTGMSYEWYARMVEQQESSGGQGGNDGDDDGQQGTSDKHRDLAELWDEDELTVQMINEVISTTKSWGSLGGNFAELLQASLKAKINWRNIFAGFRASIISSKRKLTRMKPNRHMFVQVIDDAAGHTLASASTLEADLRGADGTKVEKARKVGEKVAERAKDAGITAVVFDRGGNKYHGRVAAVAEGAREAGLTL